MPEDGLPHISKLLVTLKLIRKSQINPPTPISLRPALFVGATVLAAISSSAASGSEDYYLE